MSGYLELEGKRALVTGGTKAMDSTKEYPASTAFERLRFSGLMGERSYGNITKRLRVAAGPKRSDVQRFKAAAAVARRSTSDKGASVNRVAP
jgi:hypothetical protein